MSESFPTDVDLYDTVIDEVRRRLRTNVAGKVLKYDRALRRAQVQPLRRGVGPGGVPFDLPILPAVPVLWPRFGGIQLEGEYLPGDLVMMSCLDRESGPVFAKGGPFNPETDRTHSLADAVIVVALQPDTVPTTGPAATPQTFYVGRTDGTAYVQISSSGPGRVTIDALPGQLQLGATAVQPAVMADALQTILEGMILAGTAAVVPTDGGAAALAAMTLYLQSLPSPLPYATTKTRVE